MKNNNFWKTRAGAILSHGIHDHNNAIAGLSGYIRSNIKDERLQIEMYAFLDRASKSVDYIYEKFKEEFEKEQEKPSG